MLQPRFDPAVLLTGELASMRGGIRFGTPVCTDGDIRVALPRLCERLDDMLAVMRSHYPGDDARAFMSQWSKYYFRLAIPTAAACASLARRPLAMPLDSVALVLRGGLPHTLWLPADAVGEPVDNAAACYRSLCVEHLAPLIELLAGAVKMTPRVLWSNAGNLFEYVMSHLETSPRHADTMRADSTLLFKSATLLDTCEANPLRIPVRYVSPPSPRMEDPFRVRRVCCMRNLLPRQLLCSSCPLLLTMCREELDAHIDAEEMNG